MNRKYLRNYLVKNRLEAGCDEAGRGCLAGPVYAAAVILPPGYRHALLNDSKKLKPVERMILREHIENHALSWAVGTASAREIDRINILNASFLAMHRAIQQLALSPEFLLIDGNRFKPYPGLDHYCAVKGDSRFKSIAAASVLAKTYRDDKMLELHREFPHYQWARNKAYATADHRKALGQFGPSPWHRLSFCRGILKPTPEKDTTSQF